MKKMKRKLLVLLWIRKETTISVDHELKYLEVKTISVRILYIVRLAIKGQGTVSN